jgi:hypothetical protein
MTVHEIVYEVLKPRLNGLSFDRFVEIFRDFEFIPVIVNDAEVGAILRKGAELHAVIKEEARCRWMGKKTLKMIDDVMKEHGIVTTQVMNEHEMGHTFAKRLGFVVEKQENGITHYFKVKL